MNKTEYVFRRYKDDDLDTIYKAYEDYIIDDVQPYYNVGCGMIKSEFEESIQKHSRRSNYPPIVADKDDRAIGVVNVSYKRANKYHTLEVYMWEKKHLTKPVLRVMVEKLMNKGTFAYLLLEVPGYDLELKKAADELGLQNTGTIPMFLRHGEELHDKYFYVTNSEFWNAKGKDI